MPEIDIEKKENFKKYLLDFKKISVREIEGQKIIDNLVGKSPEINLDPTLLLDVKDYEKIISTPKIRRHNHKQYALMYFLGGINQDNKKTIDQYIEEKKYQKVNLLDPCQTEYFVSSPSEFLYWIKNADIIFTDSFHAAVFSIIFRRPFVVFDRADGGSMNSRITSLLSELNLKFCYYNSKYSLNDYEKINFDGVDNLIEMKKMQAFSYLKNSLEIDK